MGGVKAVMKTEDAACSRCGDREVRQLWTGSDLDMLVLACAGCGGPAPAPALPASA